LTYFRKNDELSPISFSNMLNERIFFIRKAACQVYFSLENSKNCFLIFLKITCFAQNWSRKVVFFIFIHSRALNIASYNSNSNFSYAMVNWIKSCTPNIAFKAIFSKKNRI